MPGTEYVSASEAVAGELGDPNDAATSTYFRTGSPYKVVIFGHTHIPAMHPEYENPGNPNYIVDPDETPCRTIYANSGTWIDQAGENGAYVETEGVPDEKRLYVCVMEYPGKTVIRNYRGFISI